jgi:tetratricopeptide (TPR) repeat protein
MKRSTAYGKLRSVGRERRRPSALAAIAILVVGAASGCAQSQQQRRAESVNTVRREATAPRLQARGDAAAAMGDMTRAEQYFMAALAAGGDPRDLTRRLLVVCVADERYPAAASHGEDYLRTHPADTEVRYAVATVYIGMGDTGQARDELERVLAERPDLADAHYALATVLRQEGDAIVDADHQFREYIRLRPEGQYADAARASLLKSVP